MMTPRLYADYMAALEHEETGARFFGLAAEIEEFCAGGLVTVGTGRESRCLLKRLDPARDEIWAFRSVEKPSIRLFGRFTHQDHFVATNMEYRTKLGARGSREWRDELVGCKAQWRSTFLTYQPHHGDHIHDYLSDPVQILGSIK